MQATLGVSPIDRSETSRCTAASGLALAPRQSIVNAVASFLRQAQVATLRSRDPADRNQAVLHTLVELLVAQSARDRLPWGIIWSINRSNPKPTAFDLQVGRGYMLTVFDSFASLDGPEFCARLPFPSFFLPGAGPNAATDHTPEAVALYRFALAARKPKIDAVVAKRARRDQRHPSTSNRAPRGAIKQL